MTGVSEEVLDEVQAAQAAIAPSEREKRIVFAYKAWEAAQEVHKEERKKTAEGIAAARANLRGAVEQGIPAADHGMRLAKLGAVELAWQDLEEAKSERVERLKNSKDVVANTERKLREEVEQSSQLSLFSAPEA